MDEKDKKIKELEEAVASEKKARAVAEDEAKKKSDEAAKLAEEGKEKDKVIDQKTKDAIGARKTYKKLSEMTEEEKQDLSQAELELKDRQEKLEAEQAEFRKGQEESRQKDIASRRGQIFQKFGGKDPKILKALEENFNRIKDSEKAQTPEEIEAAATLAYNMLGSAKPNPVNAAIEGGAGGQAPGEGERKDFSDTPEGKALAQAIGIPLEAPAKK